jgi:hypothetical protein
MNNIRIRIATAIGYELWSNKTNVLHVLLCTNLKNVFFRRNEVRTLVSHSFRRYG